MPLDSELQNLTLKRPTVLTVIRQPNSGPAVARNAALDSLGEDHVAVAFLDSDDYWEPNHLARATESLKHGAEFYFSNYRVEHSTATRFDNWPARSSAQGEPIGGCEGLYWYRGDPIADLLADRMIQTSTVVFRTKHAQRFRFSERLSVAEDLDFFLRVLLEARAVAISDIAESNYGRGVGTYQSAIEFVDSRMPAFAATLAFYVHARRFVSQDPEQRVARVIDKIALDLAADVLHCITRGRLRPVVAALAHLRSASAAWTLVLAVARTARKWLLQKPGLPG